MSEVWYVSRRCLKVKGMLFEVSGRRLKGVWNSVAVLWVSEGFLEMEGVHGVWRVSRWCVNGKLGLVKLGLVKLQTGPVRTSQVRTG